MTNFIELNVVCSERKVIIGFKADSLIEKKKKQPELTFMHYNDVPRPLNTSTQAHRLLC